MAPLDVKLTPAPLLPTDAHGTSAATAQRQPLLHQTLALLKPLCILFMVVVLGTIWVFARYTETQLIVKFFGWTEDEGAKHLLYTLYGMVAVCGSLSTAGIYVDAVGRSILGGGYEKYYWHVWTLLVMLFPLALTLVFLGCAWVVIIVWHTLTWMVGLAGLGGGR